jgi:ParB family chromosome partitioning protein
MDAVDPVPRGPLTGGHRVETRIHNGMSVDQLMTPRRRALGKPEAGVGDSGTDLPVVRVPLEAIRDNPRNPRERLRGIEELAKSLRNYGLLQAVLVRPVPGGEYVLIAGHRRLAAARLLGWSEIPALVRGVASEDDAFLLTLTENLQREDLSPREQSRALEILVRERGWSTRQIASAVQRSPAFISKRLRVFEDDVLAPLVLRGLLAVSVAEELLPLPAVERSSLAQRAAAEGWDRPAMRAAIRERGAPSGRKRRMHRAGLTRLVRELREVLDETPYWELNEAQRGELRKLFLELGQLAKAPRERQATVFPPLPSVAPRRIAKRTFPERAAW